MKIKARILFQTGFRIINKVNQLVYILFYSVALELQLARNTSIENRHVQSFATLGTSVKRQKKGKADELKSITFSWVQTQKLRICS